MSLLLLKTSFSAETKNIQFFKVIKDKNYRTVSDSMPKFEILIRVFDLKLCAWGKHTIEYGKQEIVIFQVITGHNSIIIKGRWLTALLRTLFLFVFSIVCEFNLDEENLI